MLNFPSTFSQTSESSTSTLRPITSISMRLLDTTTLQLTDFVGKAPPYAILSHTWGEEEVLFADVSNPDIPKAGWAKIRSSCDLARSLGHTWIWIDTCCIDKSSSAELSEAINSMFKFYQKAVICIAYLSDVPYPKSEADIPNVLPRSRWFTRGWTLQELLAPRHLDFYSSDWRLLGSRSSFRDLIAEMTGIGRRYISGGGGRVFNLKFASVAERMSWASKRRTTRLEDTAYCLLGIFGINMPLIYGEGERAFKKLQQAIIYEIDDQSIFTWGYRHVGVPPEAFGMWSSPLLAGHPSWFEDAGDIVPLETDDASIPLFNSGNGVTIITPLLKEMWPRKARPLPRSTRLGERNWSPPPFGAASMPTHMEAVRTMYLAPLKCRRKYDYFNCVAIPLVMAPYQHEDSTLQDTPSCFRNSHAIFAAPRSVWESGNICRPFVYFQSNFERTRLGLVEYEKRGCVIRTLPRGYSIAPVYLDEKSLLHGVPVIIRADTRRSRLYGDKGRVIALKLEGESLPDLVLLLRFKFDPEVFDYDDTGVFGVLSQVVYMPPCSSLQDAAQMMLKAHHPNDIVAIEAKEMRQCDTFMITVTQSKGYGPLIWLLDILDPQGNNVSRETDVLSEHFTPVMPKVFGGRGFLSESFESRSLASPSYSKDADSMNSRAWYGSHKASRSRIPTEF